MHYYAGIRTRDALRLNLQINRPTMWRYQQCLYCFWLGAIFNRSTCTITRLILQTIPQTTRTAIGFTIQSPTPRTGSFLSVHIQHPFLNRKVNLIGMTRFEHATPCSQSKCSTKLSYIPILYTRRIIYPPTTVPHVDADIFNAHQTHIQCRTDLETQLEVHV